MSEAPLIDPLTDPNVKLINPKRRKGAPNGNKNALRHGFYAKNLGIDSPSKLNEREMRNLLGEVAMLKDYMYIPYNRNLESSDSRDLCAPEWILREGVVLAETLRALSMAGMSLSRLLLVHKQVRFYAPGSDSTLKDLLDDMDTAATRANHLASSLHKPLDADDDDL